MPDPTRALRPRVVVVAIITATLAVGACQTAPPPAELQNPREILAAAVMTSTSAKTVRIDATAEGKVVLDLLGIGTASSIDLTGTTASADLDLERGDARATFSAPGLLGLTGDVIALDGTTYLKSTLTGALYQVQPGVDVPTPSGQARATVLKGITDLLANPTIDPVKNVDEPCGGDTCYRVDITLTPADLAVLGAGGVQTPTGLPIPIQIPDLSTATVDLAVLVAKDTTRLRGIGAAIDLGAAGTATVELTFSKWDEPMSITAPPPDQLAPSG